MARVLQTGLSASFREFLTGKNESDFAVLILHRHLCRKRVLPGDPPNIDSQGLVDPSAGDIKILMAKGLNHHIEFSLRHFPRFLGD